VTLPFSAAHFNEFVVNFDDTGKSVAHVNRQLLEKRIFGGVDISNDFPSWVRAPCSASPRFTVLRISRCWPKR